MSNEISRGLMRDFINAHPLAVLSTVDTDGVPHGTTIYAGSDVHLNLYFLTKSTTKKVNNIHAQPIVALTFSDEPTQRTLQLTGGAEELFNAAEAEKGLKLLQGLPHDYTDYRQPLSKLRAGSYTVFKVIPFYADLTIYEGSSLVNGLMHYEYKINRQ